jgi:hypothetical protein
MTADINAEHDSAEHGCLAAMLGLDLDDDAKQPD